MSAEKERRDERQIVRQVQGEVRIGREEEVTEQMDSLSAHGE